MKIFAIELWAEAGDDKVNIHVDHLDTLTTSQMLICCGQAIEQSLRLAKAVSENAKLTEGEMNRMMRGDSTHG